MARGLRGVGRETCLCSAFDGGLSCAIFSGGPGRSGKDTRAVVSFGTLTAVSLNAFGYLANGFSEGVGPLKVDLTSTLATFTAVYQLLPAFECVDRGDGKLARIGEIEGVAGVDAARAKAALGFYREIKAARGANAKDAAYQAHGYEVYPIVGLAQPTFQSATLAGGKVTLVRSVSKKDWGGDGTVPRFSATPVEESESHREIYVAEQHRSLQNFESGAGQPAWRADRRRRRSQPVQLRGAPDALARHRRRLCGRRRCLARDALDRCAG